MTKSPEDADYYAPQTGNQQVVFDYLESLLEDSDTLARDTEAELQAIEALERDEHPIDHSSVLTVEEVLSEGILMEPDAPAVAGSVVDDEPEADVVVEQERVDSMSAPENTALLDTTADLLDEDPAVEPNFNAQPAQPAQPEIHIDDSVLKPALDIPENVLNCILFQLQGLNLAIPVDDVEGAAAIERLTLHLDLTHELVLGTFTALNKETRVVDTGSWLLPGRFDPARARYEEVLILKGRKWALACDTLVKSIRMSHADIVWAGDNNTRPWMLGTNMNERCAILDVDKLQVLLDESL